MTACIRPTRNTTSAITSTASARWRTSSRSMGKRSLVIALLALTLLVVTKASAEVVRVEIASRKPWGKSSEKLQGQVYFEVDPASSAITDVALAPRNAKGQVEFSSD